MNEKTILATLVDSQNETVVGELAVVSAIRKTEKL
jgi:hypothetical protein